MAQASSVDGQGNDADVVQDKNQDEDVSSSFNSDIKKFHSWLSALLSDSELIPGMAVFFSRDQALTFARLMITDLHTVYGPVNQ